MEKTIHKEALHAALEQRGWTQATLAKEVGVSAQSVTNWLKGTGFPRPDKLLKLAMILQLGFDQLVHQPQAQMPVVAFRKRAGTKTTDGHIQKAREMGLMLRALVPLLPEISALRTQISNPGLDYARLQQFARELRAELGIGDQAVLGYEHLIGKFKECGAVLVPVLWGQKLRHENALHILLREEDVTFIFLNLDARLDDFKFWMVHELAHVYTPSLSGSDEGEDFADALAGVVLFPEACAAVAYHDAMKVSLTREIHALQQHAGKHEISLNTVFQQVSRYAQAKALPALRTPEKSIHAFRNSGSMPSVSAALFDPPPPDPGHYIAMAENVFQSDFFKALRRAINEKGIGPAYIQQVMDVSLQDATALQRELSD